MRCTARETLTLALGLVAACGQTGPAGDGGLSAAGTTTWGPGDEPGASVGTGTSSGTTEGTDGGSPSTGSGDTATGGVLFDVGGGGTGGGGVPSCKVPDDEFDNPSTCSDFAPADSFEPDIQWTWSGPAGAKLNSIANPVVGNLTDDDGNGEIDLCDTPDVVVVADHQLHVLDGATGNLHFTIEPMVRKAANPALGDIDQDGVPEIVTILQEGEKLVAFEHDGSLAWQSNDPCLRCSAVAVALADLDADGDVEIIAGSTVFDHTGKMLWAAPPAQMPEGKDYWTWYATTAADLDGDGDMEVILGHAAYHHDGSLYYHEPAFTTAPFPQVANLDDEPGPEILLTEGKGITLLDHDGSVIYFQAGNSGSNRPAAIHDFDGDDEAEYAVSTTWEYSVYEADASIKWSSAVYDPSGIATGTAFDFLGDGTAEAMYADESTMFIFDEVGAEYLQIERSSGTMIEYPIVADIDNDASAEIIVVSNLRNGLHSPTVQVIRDEQDRWMPTRRIWNQHTYHVTNVREDGTIPQHEKPSWELFNTFRTNIQLEDGGLCNPDPEG